MRLVGAFHRALVGNRRSRLLAEKIAELIPQNSRVLDVGCGDGGISMRIKRRRADLDVRGIEVFPREETRIPVEIFDGQRIPHAESSFDFVLFVDVLHHTEDPAALLREATRVSRGGIVIKDHTLEGLFAGPTLRLMDRVGNPARGVAMPYNYWTEEKWKQTFQALGLRVDTWLPKLNLFPLPADWIFGRSLHFIARLRTP